MYLITDDGDEYKSDSLKHIDGALRAKGVGVNGFFEDLRQHGQWVSDDERTIVTKVDGRTITDVQWLG